MSIVRTEKGEYPYSTICNICIDDARLSFKAKGILVYLLSKPDNWIVRVEDLAKRSREKKPAIQTGLQELKECGYATLETIRNERGHVTGKEWVVREKPIGVQMEMSFSRQAENLAVGAQPTTHLTDVGKNRLSVKTDVGKSAHIVKTDYSVKTDNIVITDVVVVGEKSTAPPPKNIKKIETEKTAPTPPKPTQPAQPPALPWRASPEFLGGADKFGQALRGRGILPENLDVEYYFGRGAEWSANSAARTGAEPLAADWAGKIHGWAVADMKQGKLHIIQPTTQYTQNGQQYTISSDSARPGGNAAGPSQQPKYRRGEVDPAHAIAGSERILARLRAAGMYLPKNDG